MLWDSHHAIQMVGNLDTFFDLVFRTWRWTPVLRSKAGNTSTVLITVPMSFSVVNGTKNCCLREVTVFCDALSSSICN